MRVAAHCRRRYLIVVAFGWIALAVHRMLLDEPVFFSLCFVVSVLSIDIRKLAVVGAAPF